MLGLPENVWSTLRTLSAFKGVADRLCVPEPAAHALQPLHHGVQAWLRSKNSTPHVFPSLHTTWQRFVVLKPSNDRSNSKAAL
jgi:hypothetical protein